MGGYAITPQCCGWAGLVDDLRARSPFPPLPPFFAPLCWIGLLKTCGRVAPSFAHVPFLFLTAIPLTNVR